MNQTYSFIENGAVNKASGLFFASEDDKSSSKKFLKTEGTSPQSLMQSKPFSESLTWKQSTFRNYTEIGHYYLIFLSQVSSYLPLLQYLRSPASFPMALMFSIP